MKKITLNFLPDTQIASMRDWVLLGLALLALVWMYQKQQILTQSLEEKMRHQQALSQRQLAPRIDATLSENLQFAQTVQQQLNLPWMVMLATLEQIKQQNPNIDLISIEPNQQRANIILKGEAPTFADVTQLVDKLRTQPAFSDAILQNHHLEQDSNNLVYVFEIHLGWRL